MRQLIPLAGGCATGNRQVRTGFTIVELLIVIVVVAILAVVSIAAYNGIRERADRTATINHVAASIKLINAYMVQESSFPHSGAGCLQESCTNYVRNPTLDTNLLKVGSLPSGASANASVEYTYNSARTIDGILGTLMITYRLPGANQGCGVDRVLRQVAGNQVYETYDGTLRNSNPNSNGNTVCYVSVPRAW
jgi:prepilin-type N-terminal cleavage/methylation domain-containing protein